MSTAPTIQVLMAAYNSRKFIAQQIDSILNQTHREVELLIRDDGSSDGTAEVIAEYEAKNRGRVHMITDEGGHAGALGNFARLIDHARPGYVMFSDSDDVWFPNKVELTLAKMCQLETQYGRDRPTLVHTDAQVVDRDLRVVAKSFWRYQYLDPVRGGALNRMLVQNVVTGCTVMINARLLELARPVPAMPSPEGAAIMHDWWIALVAAAMGTIGHIPEATMAYRQHGGNVLGAKAWGPRRAARQVAGLLCNHSYRDALNMTYHQAAALLRRLGPRMPQPQRQLVEAFATLPQRSYLQRRRLFLRHHFFKVGAARNLAMLAFL